MKRDTLFRGKLLTLHKLDDRFEVIEQRSAVCVLVLDGSKVLGVRQFRPAIGQESWELPAGLIDPGETPEEAAARELAEEVQLGGELTLVSQFYSSPGVSNEKLYLFEATNTSARDGERDEGEVLTLQWLELHQAWEAVRAGELTTSAPSALALAYAMGRAGKLA